jgi:hypothetical protein
MNPNHRPYSRLLCRFTSLVAPKAAEKNEPSYESTINQRKEVR